MNTPDYEPPSLCLREVRKRFELGGTIVEVLRGLSLEVLQGGSVAIMGPSGSGKTTLLHVAAGLELPDAGSVRIRGLDPYALDEVARAAFRRRSVGMVFQEHHLLPQLSALENVLLPAIAERRRATDDDVAWARRLLAAVGLTERGGHRPSQLSGGERQRVAVARALMNRPAVVLADEPTGALDHAAAREVGVLLARVVREANATLLVATHDPELATTLDRTCTLWDGSIRESQPSHA